MTRLRFQQSIPLTSIKRHLIINARRSNTAKTSVFRPLCPHPIEWNNKKKLKSFDTPRVDFYIEQENILLYCLQKEDGSGVPMAHWKSGFLNLDRLEREIAFKWKWLVSVGDVDRPAMIEWSHLEDNRNFLRKSLLDKQDQVVVSQILTALAHPAAFKRGWELEEQELVEFITSEERVEKEQPDGVMRSEKCYAFPENN
ncbi:hypothetical protein NPIL_447331 [Nephila pilipes]|uniref:Uncharacterized protein n=1 Tax=Nephila pilipes TaxID=299642 RepID=A0A8X6P2C2_NEPPI|nr:hypothetical protein NPIL_447331 [Nephila pilipes]